MSELVAMNPADVPDDLVKAAADGWWSASGQGLNWKDWLRAELAAVLPLHEQEVRTKIAAALNRQADLAATCHVDGETCLEAMTLARAARIAQGDVDA